MPDTNGMRRYRSPPGRPADRYMAQLPMRPEADVFSGDDRRW